MRKKIFFVPKDEIIDFAESASSNLLKATIIGTTFNVIAFSVEYHPIKEKLVIFELESSLKIGYSVDYTGDYDDNEQWIRKIC